ncbi:MAG: hypothetical protein ACRC3Y_00360, partial [Romboutsia sp.]|uniref:hypothetical protein n=1 Tax=Romboutsia sp. TaxID=1965302 RepID=UPI003F32A4BD
NDCIKINAILNDDMVIPYRLNNGRINVDLDTNLEIEYYFKPDNLEDLQDETITNSANDDFILHYAKWLYYMSDNMYEDASVWKKEYDGMKIFRQTMTIRKTFNTYGGNYD